MNFFKSLKFWVGVLIVLFAIVATVMGYVELPEKVKEVEEKVEYKFKEADTKFKETEEGYEKLSNTVEKYIAVQSAKQESQDQRQELLEQIVLNMQK